VNRHTNTFLYLHPKIPFIMTNDPYAKRLLWFVFAGSRGGLNRLRLVSILKEKPLNANQLAKELGLDYKAIQHHIGVLEKNNIITRLGEKYNVTFFVSSFLEVNMDSFNEITEKLEKSK
jgi:predicted transcriptional regulator